MATFLDDPPISHSIDSTQQRTRVYVEGGGSKARIAIPVGSTTLQVTDARWYSGTGGIVVSGPQRIIYTGKGASGGPSAPTGTQSLVVGLLGGGPYTYKTSQIDTGVETPLSAASSAITIAAVTDPSLGSMAAANGAFVPPGAPTVGTPTSGAGPDAGDHKWAVTFVTAYGETTEGTRTGTVTITAPNHTVPLTAIPTGPTGTTARKIYRTSAAVPNGILLYVGTVSGNVTTTFTDTVSDGTLGAAAPTTGTAGGSLGSGSYGWRATFITAQGETLPTAVAPATILTGGAALTGIPVSGDARVTSRKIYRTTLGGSTYLYEGTIGDNTTTTFASTIADGALGSVIPSTNTTAGGKISVTGIATGGGGVTARKLYRTVTGGSTYKLVTTINDNTTTTYTDNIADGSLGGVATGDVITELTGIPSSGAGSILYDIAVDDDVNILEQCDDAAAQTALAALEGGGSDGIIDHFIQDRRLASAEARAIGLADLALFAYPIVTIRYATRDPKTRSGKTIHVDLPSLGLLGDFTILSVTIDQIDVSTGLYPRYTVEASSVRFSFEDVLRRLRLDAA